MKPEKSEAFVLQTFPSRERDKLVVFLTPLHGKKKGWAYGARTMKSRFGASLEPLSKVRVGWVERESDEVVRIESVDLIRSMFDVHRNLATSLAATYLAELADTFAHPDDPAELLFRLLDRTTEALLAGAPPRQIIAYADIWILKLAGIFPSMRECVACDRLLSKPIRYDGERQGFVCEFCAGPGAILVPNDIIDLLAAVQRLPVEEFARMPLTDEQFFDLRTVARGLRRNFLGHELKSHDLLAGVL